MKQEQLEHEILMLNLNNRKGNKIKSPISCYVSCMPIQRQFLCTFPKNNLKKYVKPCIYIIVFGGGFYILLLSAFLLKRNKAQSTI